jgi:hypothetical protein
LRWPFSPTANLSRLHQLQTDLATGHGGRFPQGAERHGVVVRVEETVERGEACVHALGHLSLGDTLLLHGRRYLARHDPVDGGRGDTFKEPLLVQPVERMIFFFMFLLLSSPDYQINLQLRRLKIMRCPNFPVNDCPQSIYRAAGKLVRSVRVGGEAFRRFRRDRARERNDRTSVETVPARGKDERRPLASVFLTRGASKRVN